MFTGVKLATNANGRLLVRDDVITIGTIVKYTQLHLNLH